MNEKVEIIHNLYCFLGICIYLKVFSFLKLGTRFHLILIYLFSSFVLGSFDEIQNGPMHIMNLLVVVVFHPSQPMNGGFPFRVFSHPYYYS